MFPYGHANTTNLVERMWQYVKYTLLGGKVNRRLDDLILAIIGNPETGQQFGGGTLVDHYDRAHSLSESGKYARRGGDKSWTTKLQRARWLVSRYKKDRLSNLEIIDECHMEFAMRSQSDPRKWHTLSLSREWCECDDYGPICKHMWALKMIVDEEFPHLLDLLPSVYEPNGFMHLLDTYESCENVNEGPSDGPSNGPNENPNKTMNERPSDGAGDGGYDLKEKLLKISSLTTSVRMEALTVEQYETVNNAAKSILAILQGVVDLAPRPIQIPMPREGGSITPIQAHVTNTRLGHGRPNKK